MVRYLDARVLFRVQLAESPVLRGRFRSHYRSHVDEMKHIVVRKESHQVHVPFEELRKLVGVPETAVITYISADKQLGLIMEYEK